TSIAIRVAMSELRRHRWKNVSLEEVIADANLAPERVIDDGSEPSIQRERKAVIEMMHGLIQNDLTEKQRVALLAELKEMPQDEIARHIGSNRNAVYKLTHDARKRLKQGFEAVGYEMTDIQSIFAN
ncbi:MAG: sigma factor-like helix-turn-helix DNA-binding protein, partial [Nitrosomonadaceae bacterium]